MAKQGYRYGKPRMTPGLYMGEKAASYFLPVVLVLAAFPLACLVHLVATSATWTAIVAVAFTVLAGSSWHFWGVRRRETRLTAVAFTVALLGWVLFAGTGTPWGFNTLKAYGIGGFVAAAAWMMRHAALSGINDHDTAREQGGAGWLEKVAGAWKGGRVLKQTTNGEEARQLIDLEGSAIVGDAQRSRDQIAATLGVDANQVKVLRVPGNEGQAEVVLNKAQDTSRPLVYTGPSAPGGSIADAPLYLGRRTDRSSIEWWIVGSDDPQHPRPLAHTKLTGATGSGKTETLCTAILDLRWRRDCAPVVADPAKFQQGFGDIEECLALAAKTPEDAKQLMMNLADVVEYRADLLGNLERADGGKGYKQWMPECFTRHGVPALLVDFEEAADIIPYVTEELDEAVRKLRSVGVHLSISMQTMPFDNLPRKSRGQFGQSLAHGQIEYQDAKYALSPQTLEAGADPTKWKNDNPGCLYAEMTGTDPVHWPIDGRALYMTPAQKAASIAQSRQYWCQIDPGTMERLAYNILAEYSDEPDVDETEAGAEEISDQGMEVDGMPDPFEDASGRERDVNVHEPLRPPGAAGAFSFGKDEQPRTEMDVTSARAMLQNRIDILEASGATQVTFADLRDLPDLVGRKRSWVYDNLRLLVQAGRLKEHRPPDRKVLFEIIKRYPGAESEAS